jgi:hypothetical protein
MHGVTLIAAAGNEHTNLAQVTTDVISPDVPPGSEYTRTIDNNCLSMPGQGNNVIPVSAVWTEHAEGRLFELRLPEDRRRRSRRLVPRHPVDGG